ncbi:hypothetical protein [Fimbriiglobus ruber]|uniref:Uncharacterized protein n=1 Tax=Fimbriiglobus ruber TaxID=1908690 RepID=A0A225EB03_9BACT|nr:hypothetical protein [Fimbriiglobus ruber]OWK45577.1 hypothetical protein FRUB_01908 [Fimbriiglobus ruber]
MSAVFDITSQIDDIKAEFPDYFRRPEALEKAKAVWRPECQVNGCGVFVDGKEDIVACCGRAKAAVGVCRVRDCVFVHCCSFEYSLGGFGYAPSVWSSAPHESAEQAHLAGIEELLRRISGRGYPGDPPAAASEQAALRSQLENHIRQPSLF